MSRISIKSTVALMALCCSPALLRAEPWRFIATGDSRSNDASVGNGVNQAMLGEIASAIVTESPVFVLFGGDLVVGSSTQSVLESQLQTWLSVMQPVYNAGIKVYPVRGNHDSGSKAAWDNVFSGSYANPQNGPAGEENVTFSFGYRKAFIVGTDQYGSHSRQVNQTWLDQQFAANQLPHVFVFGHNPAFEVTHPDCLNDYPDARDAFWDSIGAEGGRTYFCGHDHLIHHLRAQDSSGNWIHQVLLGSAGAPYTFYDGAIEAGTEELYYSWWGGAFEQGCDGYGVVEIDGLNVTVTVKERAGGGAYQASHSFSYSIPPPSPDLDRDGDVDGFDFLTFSNCFNGSNVVQRPECANIEADLDFDEDVDGFDFLTFSNCYNGSNQPPRCP
jgi:hypothetical protein